MAPVSSSFVGRKLQISILSAMPRRKHNGLAAHNLLDLGRDLSAAEDEQQAARVIFGLASRLWAADLAALDRIVPGQPSPVPVLHLHFASGTWTGSQPGVSLEVPDNPSSKLQGAGPRSQVGRECEGPGPTYLPELTTPAPASSQMRVAIGSGNCLYLLTIRRHTLPSFTPADLRGLRRLADHCAGSLARLRSIAELRQSNARLHAFFDDAPEATLITDIDGNILALNKAAFSVLGEPRKSMEGCNLEAVAPPSERTKLAAALAQAAGRGEALVEAVASPNARASVPIEFRLRRVESGDTATLLVNVRDLNVHRRDRDALRDSEQRFEAVFRRSPTPMGIGRLGTGTILEVNDALAILLGYQNEELVGRTPVELGLLSSQLLHALVTSTLESCGAIQREIQIPHRSGERRDCLVTLKQVQWAGEPCALGVLIDVTAQRRAEAELRRLNSDLQLRVQEGSIALQDTEAHYRALFDGSADAILIVAADGPDSGRIVQANPAALAMTGFSREEICSMRLEDLDVGASRELRQERIRRVLAGEQLRFDVRQRRKNGAAIPLEVNISQFVVGNRALLVGVGRDVTERTRMEASLRETEKLAATGRVVTSIAHEINNPLGTIWNALWLLQDVIPADSPNRRQFDLIKREMQRVIRIVGQMLTLYRPATQMATEFSLTDLIDSITELWLPTVRNAEVSLTHEGPPEPIQVCLPQGPVSQILVNLVANAVEACPRGGRIVIHSTLSGSELSVAVTDDGPGVPPGIADRIFEPFFSTKSSSSGTGLGLGLAVSRSLAESMGGTLDYAGSGQSGARFVLKLRRTLPPGVAVTEALASTSIAFHERTNELRR